MNRYFGLVMAGWVVWGGFGPAPSLANDSAAELAVGGLTFTKNTVVSIESEDLRITPETVTVRYLFLNQSNSPVTLTVAFPLPDIDLADGANLAFPKSDPLNFMGFSTRVDGEPINFTIDQRAFLNNKDVTTALRDMKIPLLPIGASQLAVSELPQAIRDRAISDGLLVQSGTNDKGQPLYDPSWTLKTSVIRQQTFPPGKQVVVEHRYSTSVGMSFDSVLRKALRQSKALAPEVQRYKTNYCIGDDFLKSIDKLAGTDEANKSKILERRISYVLKTGANWAGPIKKFNLVVDKGHPDRIVSLCADGLKKVSPTSFEWRAVDFTPTRDLNIILVGRK